jgi:hypothetical protein
MVLNLVAHPVLAVRVEGISPLRAAKPRRVVLGLMIVEEERMDPWLVLFLSLFWCGPIGLGFFLMGVGVYYWGKAQNHKTE